MAIAGGCERVEGVQGGGAQLCFGTKISRRHLGCDSCMEGVEGLCFFFFNSWRIMCVDVLGGCEGMIEDLLA